MTRSLLALIVLVGCGPSGFQAADIRTAPVAAPEAPETHSGTEGSGTTPTGTGAGTQTDTTITEPPDTTVPGGAVEACYVGAARDWGTCLELVAPAPLPAEYAYPAPLNGSPQYAEPVHYLDLAFHDPATMVAPNFRLDELAQEYKGQFGVVQPHAVERLQDLRDELGPLVVNSGYRSPDYNAGIGGATWSRHMYGDGFDLDPVSVTLDALTDACYAHGAGYVGVYEAHIHCDWRDDTVDPYFFGLSPFGAFGDTPTPRHDARIEVDGDHLVAPAEGWDEGEPLRRWSAWSADGALLASEEGRTFAPPAETARVTVVVGLELEREFLLTP